MESFKNSNTSQKSILMRFFVIMAVLIGAVGAVSANDEISIDMNVISSGGSIEDRNGNGDDRDFSGGIWVSPNGTVVDDHLSTANSVEGTPLHPDNLTGEIDGHVAAIWQFEVDSSSGDNWDEIKNNPNLIFNFSQNWENGEILWTNESGNAGEDNITESFYSHIGSFNEVYGEWVKNNNNEATPGATVEPVWTFMAIEDIESLTGSKGTFAVVFEDKEDVMGLTNLHKQADEIHGLSPEENNQWATFLGTSGLGSLTVNTLDEITVKYGDSIQTAIDSVSEGGTVYVKEGTYEETLDINKELSLIGQGDVVIDSTGKSGFSGAGNTNSANEISSDNVYLENIKFVGDSNLRGITITGENAFLKSVVLESMKSTGINIFDATGTKLENIEVYNTDGAGILAKGLDITIDSVNTTNNSWGGIAISNDGSYSGSISKATIVGDNNIDDGAYLESDEKMFSFGYENEDVVLQQEDFSFFVGGNDKDGLDQILLMPDKETAFAVAQEEQTHIEDLFVSDIESIEFFVSGDMSIQNAIDAAEEGDTVVVEEGTYEEDFTINKDNVKVTSINNDEATIKGSVRFEGNNIYLTNLVLEGEDGWATESASDRGLKLVSGENHNIINNTIKDYLTGISMQFAGGTPSLVTIENNTFENNGVAVGSTEDVNGIYIYNNLFSEGYNAISLGDGTSNVEIDSNTFENMFNRHIGNYDEDLTLNISEILENNEFDRYVISNNFSEFNGAIFTSIQAAIDSVSEGGTVYVGEGTYEEILSINVNNLTLVGDSSTIEGSINVNSNDVKIEGFTINNTQNEARGISVASSNEDVEILNNTIIDFTTGITPNEGTTNLLIENNTFENNTAGVGSTETSENITIVNNFFSNNSEGIGLATTSYTIEDNTFENNDVHIGIYLEEIDRNSLLPTNSFDRAIVGNTAIYSSLASSQNVDVNESTNTTTINENTSTRIGGESSIEINENTQIRRLDNKSVDLDNVTGSVQNATNFTIDGESSTGVVQWGMENTTLEFTPAITIKLEVGNQFNGETLEVRRSVDGNTWTTDGLSSNTCEVQNGICEFQTNQASYFGSYEQEETTSSSGGSSGGGGFRNFVSTENETTDEEPQEATPIQVRDVEEDEETTDETQEIDSTQTGDLSASEEVETTDEEVGFGGFIIANTGTIVGVILGLLIIGALIYVVVGRRKKE